MHRPYEPAGIEIGGADVARPALAPLPDRAEDRAQFLSRLRESIVAAARVAGLDAFDDAGAFERAQPLLEQRRRQAWYASANLVEAMRAGQQVHLEKIRANSLTIVTSASFRAGEQLKIRLRNDVQRISADLRGFVRRIGLRKDGAYLVEIELFTRLMPLDVMSLRRAGVTDVELPDKIWV